jgi:hypothetical protein
MHYLTHTGTYAEAVEISRQYWLMLSAEHPDETSTTHLGEVLPDPQNPNRWAIHIPDQPFELSAKAKLDELCACVMVMESEPDKAEVKAAMKAACMARAKIRGADLVPAKLKGKNRFLSREQLESEGWFAAAVEAEETPKEKEKPVKAPKK